MATEVRLFKTEGGPTAEVEIDILENINILLMAKY